MAGTLTLDDGELQELTNGLTQPAAQLRELHRQGFTRACRPRGGRVVLYRAHFEAVVAARDSGQAGVAAEQNGQPDSPDVVVGLRAWAAARRERNGQKTQGR